MDPVSTHVLATHKADRPLMACRYSPDGEYVFAASEDYKVWRFRVADGSKVELDTDAWVRGMAFADAGKTLITGGYDGRLIWWDALAESPTPVRVVEAHSGWIRAVAVSPDGKLVASVGNDQIVRLWNHAEGTLLRELPGHESHIYNVAFHPSGETLLSGDLHGHLFDWEIASGNKKRVFKAETLSKYDTGFRAQIGGFRGLTFNAEGTLVAASGITNVSNAFAGVGNPSVVILDYAKGEQVIEHLSKGPLQGVAWNVAFHPQNVIIGSSGGSGGYFLFWKPGEKETFHQFKMPSDVRDFALSPDGLHLAAAQGNGQLTISLMNPKQA